MSREWKPGDVALVRCDMSDWHPALRVNSKSGDGWICRDGDGARAEYVTHARPAVVIDPEDREQVERLVKALHKTPWFGEVNIPTHTSLLINALREFANPTPAKPDEPQGLGAVVEDADGKRFVRHPAEGNEPNAWCDEIGCGRPWSRVPAVRILSEGITP